MTISHMRPYRTRHMRPRRRFGAVRRFGLGQAISLQDCDVRIDAVSREHESAEDETTRPCDHERTLEDGRWNCRKCNCSKYDNPTHESGGYKCKTCGHLYEDHRS